MRPFTNSVYLQLNELPVEENISSEGTPTNVIEPHPSNSVSKNCNESYEVYNVKLNLPYAFNQVNLYQIKIIVNTLNSYIIT